MKSADEKDDETIIIRRGDIDRFQELETIRKALCTAITRLQDADIVSRWVGLGLIISSSIPGVPAIRIPPAFGLPVFRSFLILVDLEIQKLSNPATSNPATPT